MRSSGLDVRDWSGTGAGYASATSATAYDLNANASGVNPSNNNNRWNGFPVRLSCRGSVPIFIKFELVTMLLVQIVYNKGRDDGRGQLFSDATDRSRSIIPAKVMASMDKSFTQHKILLRKGSIIVIMASG